MARKLTTAINNRKQINAAINNLILIESSEVEIEPVEEETVEDYKKLNDKCDVVITKIKDRKNKKIKK